MAGYFCIVLHTPKTARRAGLKRGQQTMLVHRLVAKMFLGVESNDTIVHHKNGLPSDNRVENLQPTTIKDHNVLHNQKYPTEKLCVVCGGAFTPEVTKRKRQQACGPTCKSILLKQRWVERRQQRLPGM
jgi:predicted nucleic acid-binding Zn ribbon protein